ncbi:MAG: PEPxxWA-CTERM sorting domain-containing protein [Sphingomonadales bacterium]|nr:PEPxxWA-CTERM sorting domain-containing protein [Sphingomonadales bacterium]
MNTTSLASWAYWEKNKYRALVALAVVACGAVAATASNERRMFAFPAQAIAFTASPEWERLVVSYPVTAYLRDGCTPELDGTRASFERAVDKADCGEGRMREPAPLASDPEPSAFFAMPDVPMLIDEIGLPQVPELTPPSQRMQLLGRGGGPAPTRVASLTPPILVSGVPEPGSWLLMILGFGGAGALLRRSRMRASRLAASR